ncbi:hypothetical protein SEA_KUDEFRE_135 [Gordonia phage Kudefre]|uniref:Uncharacterized protein n=1 Tax=Gordonia phage Kudefre TaxID=2885975 RepID=A0AAE8YAL9_9CAUD|nr:hypothetical protein L3Y24_gp108 [Gordonia phage Kudefre]UDL15351.1 hypothetical protein SEA_KUDEFRE_135 [Gordonia phage Kudefre]
MTGYNQAHGDTNGVRMNLANEQGAYSKYMGAVSIAWWDEDDNTWNDVDKAAARLKQDTTELQEYARALGDDGAAWSEIRDADLSSVDFVELITEELEELNVQEGRDRLAGLS